VRRFDVAVVGCGGVSQMHFDGYAAHPERVRVVAACDPEPERVSEAQRRYGFARACASLDEMLAAADWEVAVVCTPTPVREPVVRMLAAAGKHVFVEKPLADTYDEARRLVAICAEAGVRLAVNQNFRYHYPFHIARAVIADGGIGRVLSVLHQDLFFRQDGGWRTERPRHALSVMGIHWLDGFRWMLGDEARSLVCRTHASPAIDCAGETEAHVQIAFAGGAAVSYVQSFSSPVARTETLVLGETGTLVLNYDGAARFDRDHRKEPKQRWANPFAGPGKPESAFQGLERLLAAIETPGTEPENSGHDNLRTVALLEAAYRSAEQQRPVSLAEEMTA